jgi:hypothetical protein
VLFARHPLLRHLLPRLCCRQGPHFHSLSA